MQSEGNHDILSSVANTIIGWYEQTQNIIKNRKLVRPNFDSELLGILLAAKSQTSGALKTLANGHMLSTHALLRVLVETFVVIAWALNVEADEEEKSKCDEVYKRLRRWDYTRLKKDKALLEGLSRIPEVESAIKKAKSGSI